MTIKIDTSKQNAREEFVKLKTGDTVLLSGIVYTSRDAVHKKLKALIEQGKPLPYPIQDAILYYAGPTPAKNGLPIGSCGPTTSSRMDPYTPQLLDMGLLATIGKGERSEQVVQACRRNHAVYLCAIGGAGALACQSIKKAEVIAFEELGCESVKKLTIQDFPLTVAIDTNGNNLFAHRYKEESVHAE